MPKCDIIVVGGSAGAIEAMQELAHDLPRDLEAAVFIVLHIPADFPSMLPQILARAGPLPVRHAKDEEPVKPGQILVAPPDRHMTIEDGHVRVKRGARENRHRPAIDPLFRSAARVFDSRVIGVILSGQLDDGSAGLRAIRSMGGLAIVQDPADASAPQMPRSALEHGGADFVLPKARIGPQLVSLMDHCGRDPVLRKKSKSEGNESRANNKTKLRPDITVTENQAEANLQASRASEGQGTPSVFACPECSGVLWELKDGNLVRFRCRVGHSYTMASLAEEQVRETENALWAAMRALEEKAALATRIAESTRDFRSSERLREQAQADRGYAETIRKMLFSDDKESNSAA